jgi:hypothetical protein
LPPDRDEPLKIYCQLGFGVNSYFWCQRRRCDTMSPVAKRKPRGTTGRRPTGIRPGEKVSQYPRFAVRLPDDVRAQLEAAASALKRPAWRVIVDAIVAYVGSGPGLSEDERRVVRAVLRLHAKDEQ